MNFCRLDLTQVSPLSNKNDYVLIRHSISQAETASCTTDGVLEYAKEVFSLGMLYLEFQDAIREGDVIRVLRCWKYFLPIFRASGRKNYALEALNVLFQHTYYLPPRLRMQLLYSRFVNVHGREGHNISSDLHMEHMNRTTKETLEHLGANKTEKAIVRSSKCAHSVMLVMQNFDEHLGIRSLSGAHKIPDTNRDITTMTEILMKAENFQNKGKRTHANFPKIKSNGLCRSLDIQKFHTWIKDHYEPHTQ